MKRKITLSIALVLSIVALSLMGSGLTMNAVATRTYTADTGMITLGPNEFVRLTVVPRSRVSSLHVTFSAQVTQSVCSGGVCMHTITSQTATGPITLMPGQAASYDILPTPGASAVRGMVLSDSPEMQANALIIDSNTGQTNGLFRFFGDSNGDR